MPNDWQPRSTDVNHGEIADDTRAYFVEHQPESITPMSVPDLRDTLDPDSPIEFQRALHERCTTLIEANRDTRHRINMEFDTTQHEFVTEYAHAIPTPTVLDYLCDRSPLAELFAGNGYWAYELTRAGCDVTAFDADPPHDPWTTVQKADQDALLAFADTHSPVRLLLCWPPIGPAAYEALLIAQPDDVFFVGERPTDGLKPMADENFFKLLDARYRLHHTIELPSLMGHMDDFYHFTRE